MEECEFRVLVLKGGSRGGGTENCGAGKLEAPVGNDTLVAGYCNDCCMEGGNDMPNGG